MKNPVAMALYILNDNDLRGTEFDLLLGRFITFHDIECVEQYGDLIEDARETLSDMFEEGKGVDIAEELIDAIRASEILPARYLIKARFISERS